MALILREARAALLEKLRERAGLLATFYVMSYLAFSLPAVAAGLSVPLIGLSAVAYAYGAVVILLAVISLVASVRSGR